MKILSISTATNHLSIALNEDQKIIAEKNEEDERNHSEHLDPLIMQLLNQQHLSLKNIDRFAVAIGPGSYTGLRIGVTTVKMFASILQKEVVGVSTLQALAKGIKDKKALILAGLDARNDNYFAGGYVFGAHPNPQNVIADGHYHIDAFLAAVKDYLADHAVSQLVFVGSGWQKQDELLKDLDRFYVYAKAQQNVIHAGLIGKLALAAKPVDPDLLLPRYLRRTSAELQWHKKTGKPYGPDSSYVEEV